MTRDDKILTLHKYWLWADTMRCHFERTLKAVPKGSPPLKEFNVIMYLSLWYSLLYVVSEGWRKRLKLADPRIYKLLSDTRNLCLPERFRHGVFHFQPEYFDRERFLPFPSLGRDSSRWIRSLHAAFGDFFVAWLKDKGLWPGT